MARIEGRMVIGIESRVPQDVPRFISPRPLAYVDTTRVPQILAHTTWLPPASVQPRHIPRDCVTGYYGGSATAAISTALKAMEDELREYTGSCANQLRVLSANFALEVTSVAETPQELTHAHLVDLRHHEAVRQKVLEQMARVRGGDMATAGRHAAVAAGRYPCDLVQAVRELAPNAKALVYCIPTEGTRSGIAVLTALHPADLDYEVRGERNAGVGVCLGLTRRASPATSQLATCE